MYGESLYRLITKGYDGMTTGRVPLSEDSLVECALTAYTLCRLEAGDKTGRNILNMTQTRAAVAGGARAILTVNSVLRLLDETPVHK